MNKFDLMKYTGNDQGVDSALPEPWIDELTKLGLNRSNIFTRTKEA
jgi:hypothetical protein